MVNVAINFRAYTLNFKAPLIGAFGTLRHRQGWTVCINDGDICALGDCINWPGESNQSLENAIASLASQKWDKDILPRSIADISSLTKITNHPALACGLELAALDWIAKSNAQSLASVLNPAPRKVVESHVLVADLQNADAIVHQTGARFLKLKVHNFDTTWTAIQCWRDSQNAHIKLRLDVNGAWSLRDSVSRLAQLEKLGIDWIEQPVLNIAELVELKKNTSLALAVDEGVHTTEDIDALVSKQACDVVVIKPLRCGGWLNALGLAQHAARCGLRVCITSVLDSAIGRCGALHLAAALPEKPVACGLSPLFTNDLYELSVVDGSVKLPLGPGLGITPEHLQC